MNCYCLIPSILDFRLNLKFADMKDKEKRDKGKLRFVEITSWMVTGSYF